MPKAIITITTGDGEDTNIDTVFDPPTEPENTTLAEHLACTAIRAMVAESHRLIEDRDTPAALSNPSNLAEQHDPTPKDSDI